MNHYYRIVDHTADIAVRASGSSRAELFAAVLAGVMRLLKGEREKNSKTTSSQVKRGLTCQPAALSTFQLSAQGVDDEELLVELVNKFLFACQTEKWFPLQVQSIIFPDDKSVSAEFIGCLNSPKGSLKREIKAATYHNLKITRGERWRTTLVLDV
ncbi:MAG: archease [Calditrichaeota bacterium]|nr:archease [Calditrichota bacterium]